jgi:ABC-type molybdate transport system substrate-binding protein
MTSAHSARSRTAGRRRLFGFFASLTFGCSIGFSAAADNVKVLTESAFAPVVTAVAGTFKQRTGHTLVVAGDTAAALARRIRDGEDFDLAILPPEQLEALGKEGAVSDGSIVALARVRPGAQAGTVFAGAVSTSAASSQAALSLLILLASEDTQLLLKEKGLAAPGRAPGRRGAWLLLRSSVSQVSL